MTNQHGVIFRILADLFVGFFASLAFFAVSHSGNGTWLIGVIGALLFAAGMAGYLEPFAKKVWIHPM